MAATQIYGVGDPVQIQSTPPNGETLWHIDIPSGQTWVVESLIWTFPVAPASMGKVVFHLFVTALGRTFSPFWDYGVDNSQGEWWRPKSVFPHLPVIGPASIDFIVVNIDTQAWPLYWTALLTQTP